MKGCRVCGSSNFPRSRMQLGSSHSMRSRLATSSSKGSCVAGSVVLVAVSLGTLPSRSTRRAASAGVIRDPALNHRLALPRVRDGAGAAAIFADAKGPRPMIFHAGQPPEIAEEHARVWAERAAQRA